MESAPHPPDESSRFAVLAALGIFNSPKEAEFEALAQSAALLCDAPVALISLADSDRHWFKAHVGVPGGDRDQCAFPMCAHAMLQDDILEVSDLTQDLRFRDAPAVIGQAGVRFYAGAPVRLSGGPKLGALSVLDYRPRTLTNTQREVLAKLANTASRLLDARYAESVLQERRQRLEDILHGTGAGTWEWNVSTGETILNERWAEMLGYTLEELTPVTKYTCTDNMNPEDFPRITDLLQQHFEGKTDRYMAEVRMRHKKGHWVWVWTNGQLKTRTSGGDPEWMFGTHLDITKTRLLSRELEEQHELLNVTLQSIGDAVITTDAAGLVTWLNPVAERMTGWAAAEATGRSLEQVFHIVNEETRLRTENPVATCLQQGKIVGLANHTVLLSRNGDEFGINDSASPIRNANGDLLGVVLVFHDVTEQRRLSAEMTYRATHDALTGLTNRVEFETRLRKLIARTEHSDLQHALMYVDLDQFKIVNDTCGHSVGDRMLIEVSRLLADSVRSNDLVARLGGDEFAILLEACAPDAAKVISQQICDRMGNNRFSHDGQRFRIGASIGLVLIDNRWKTIASIMQAADTACYSAKESGRSRVHEWRDNDMALRSRHGEMQWTTRIEQALDENRFVLFAQKIRPLRRNHNALRAEVLLRMRGPEGELILPGAFLPAAERFQLASRVDRWVIAAVVDWMRACPNLAEVDMLSINLSGQSVGDRAFHQWCIGLFNGAGAQIYGRICLEITETSAVTNIADATLFIEEMRGLGVRIALDDFGAGASSFSYLKALPVDVLKIDGQFITTLIDDPLNEVAVRSFIDVAKIVGVSTIAEFVDRAEVMERIQALGVDSAQGFYVHRPAPIAELISAQADFAPS